jgi:predicted transposase YbfD/YdcC
MSNNLIEKLKTVKDFRKDQGTRHPLWLILLIIILGEMQGYLGYRALGGFAKSNIKDICETFGIAEFRVPSYSCIRRVMLGLKREKIVKMFNLWAANEYKEILDSLWLALDGKVMRNTVINANDEKQNFLKTISLFSQETGLVLHIKQIENKTGSEIASVQDTIRDCQLKNKIFTGDSLQCQTETIRSVLETNNNYVIAVKKNQPNLYNHLDIISKNESKISNAVEKDNSHGRKIKREVSVFEFTGNKKKKWDSVKSVIKVTRSGKRGNKPYEEEVYYISNCQKDANIFSKIIRGHWGIENQLHWVKDVIFKEDKSPIKDFDAASNISILQTIGINLLRSCGFISITEGQRWLDRKWDRLMILLA